jgi:hypothetical protein
MDRKMTVSGIGPFSDALNDFERLNQILHHLAAEPNGDYVLDYCVSEFGGPLVMHFDLVAQLLLDEYAQSDPGDLQFMTLTEEGAVFISKGGYPVPNRQRARE